MGVVVMKKICLGEAVMRVIQKAKAMEKPKRAIEVVQRMSMENAKVVVIACLQIKVQYELAHPKERFFVRTRWLPRLQR